MADPVTHRNHVVQAWLDLAEKNRGTDRFRISYTAFRSILRAYAPTRDELAGMTVLDPESARGVIDTMLDEGRLRTDSTGERIVGAGGLSLEPARQSLQIGSRTFGTWCSLDAVGIPAGLGIDAVVEAHCGDTGEPVRIEITGGEVISEEPEGVLITLVPASVAESVFSHL
jgi:hypothetical protein